MYDKCYTPCYTVPMQRRDKLVGFRVTREEYERLLQLAKGEKVADFLLMKGFMAYPRSGLVRSFKGYEVIERARRDLGIKISNGEDMQVLYPEDTAYKTFIGL